MVFPIIADYENPFKVVSFEPQVIPMSFLILRLRSIPLEKIGPISL